MSFYHLIEFLCRQKIKLLKVLTDKLEIDNIFSRVEWPTLIFFASLFVVMESLARLGFLNWIGKLVEEAILSVRQSRYSLLRCLRRIHADRNMQHNSY